MATDLAKRITDLAEANRSAAYQWLKLHYAELAGVVRVRGSWTGIRAAAIEAGVKVSRGPPNNKIESDPSVHALRSAWRRVEADMAQSDQPASKPKAISVSRPKPVDQGPPREPDDDFFKTPKLRPPT